MMTREAHVAVVVLVVVAVLLGFDLHGLMVDGEHRLAWSLNALVKLTGVAAMWHFTRCAVGRAS